MNRKTSEEGRRMCNNKEHTWVVIRTFNRREGVLSEFLRQRGVTHFIPVHYAEKFAGSDRKPRRVLVPIIHNFVFICKSMPMAELESLLSECAIPLYILKTKETNQPAEISNREMLDFRMLCDPAFQNQVTVRQAEDETDASIGREVEIVHGAFKGVRGRLYRKQKQYWFIKTLVGISIELRITRWFCKPL